MGFEGPCCDAPDAPPVVVVVAAVDGAGVSVLGVEAAVAPGVDAEVVGGSEAELEG